MIEKAFIKPGQMPDGTPLKVRKPMGGVLADAGEFVVLDSYWRRRLADQDVVTAEPTAEQVAAETGEQPAKATKVTKAASGN